MKPAEKKTELTVVRAGGPVLFLPRPGDSLESCRDKIIMTIVSECMEMFLDPETPKGYKIQIARHLLDKLMPPPAFDVAPRSPYERMTREEMLQVLKERLGVG